MSWLGGVGLHRSALDAWGLGLSDCLRVKISMVPGERLELSRCFHRRILNPVRLPIPPSRHGESGIVGKLRHEVKPACLRCRFFVTDELRGW